LKKIFFSLRFRTAKSTLIQEESVYDVLLFYCFSFSVTDGYATLFLPELKVGKPGFITETA